MYHVCRKTQKERQGNAGRELTSAVENLKGQTSNSEVVGLALKLAKSNMDKFLEIILKDIKDEPMLELLRNPARRGEKTDARRIEEYLYG